MYLRGGLPTDVEGKRVRKGTTDESGWNSESIETRIRTRSVGRQPSKVQDQIETVNNVRSVKEKSLKETK